MAKCEACSGVGRIYGHDWKEENSWGCSKCKGSGDDGFCSNCKATGFNKSIGFRANGEQYEGCEFCTGKLNND